MTKRLETLMLRDWIIFKWHQVMPMREFKKAVYMAGYYSDVVESDRLFKLNRMGRQQFNDIRYKGFIRSGVSGLLWPF